MCIVPPAAKLPRGRTFGRVSRAARAGTVAPMIRSVLAGLALAVVLATCGAGASAAPTFGDTTRVWCGAHPMAVVSAGHTLGIAPSKFVEEEAAIEQASLDGNQQLAQSLILQRVGRGVTAQAGEMDPRMGTQSMPSWEIDSAADFARACLAAYQAR